MNRLISFMIVPPTWWFRFVDALFAFLSLCSMLSDGASALSVSLFVCSLMLLATGFSARVYYAFMSRLRIIVLAASLRRP